MGTKVRLVLLLLISVATTCLTGCGGGGRQSYGTVSGQIVEQASQSPVAGVIVQLMKNALPSGPASVAAITTTGSDGFYVLQNVLPGNYSVVLVPPLNKNVLFAPAGSTPAENIDIHGGSLTFDFVALDAGMLGTVTPPAVDLAASLSASASQIAAGQALTYTLVIANNPHNNPAFSSTATNILGALSLPASNVTFVSADPGCFPSANTVVCQFDDLPSGASSRRDVVVTPTQAGVLQAQVVASSKEPDGDRTNNAASLSTTVTGPR